MDIGILVTCLLFCCMLQVGDGLVGDFDDSLYEMSS